MAATTSRRIKDSDVWRERLGLARHECTVLIAVITYYGLYQQPVLSTHVQRMLTGLGEPGSSREFSFLARRGWIRVVGKVGCERAYEPTPRGYRILGLDVPRKAA